MIDPPPCPRGGRPLGGRGGLTQPYTALAIAVMQQALADAYANLTTSKPDSTQPTPAAVADARAWLSSPHAAQLADLLELHPQTPSRYVNAHPPAEESRNAECGLRIAERRNLCGGSAIDQSTIPPGAPAYRWLTVAESAATMRMHPEHVRKLIRAGHLRAAKAADGWGWRVDAASIQAYLHRK